MQKSGKKIDKKIGKMISKKLAIALAVSMILSCSGCEKKAAIIEGNTNTKINAIDGNITNIEENLKGYPEGWND